MSTIKLRSNDGEVFEVDLKVAKISTVIKDMIDIGVGGDDGEPCPLKEVSGRILKMVIEWLKYHRDDPPIPDDVVLEKRTDDIDTWDVEFVKGDMKTLYDLTMAANYLDIQGLLDLTCKTMAKMIKGKTTDQIRETFKLEEED